MTMTMIRCQMLGCEDPTFVEGEYGKPIQSETMPDVEVTACDPCHEEWLNLKAYHTGSHEDWLLNSAEVVYSGIRPIKQCLPHLQDFIVTAGYHLDYGQPFELVREQDCEVCNANS